MNEKLKKKLTSNWFKILQDSICDDIEKIEGKKNIFNSNSWERNKKRDERIWHGLKVQVNLICYTQL